MSNTSVRTRLKSVSVESSKRIGGENKEVTPSKTTTSSVPTSGPMGYVTVEGGITKNLGDYNSARIAVAVCLPCGPTVEDAAEAYKQVSALVDRLMNEEYEKVMSTEE